MNNEKRDNILTFNLLTPEELRLHIAANVRARRLEMSLTQKGMSSRTGIPLATYKRFEQSGEISLSNLIMIAVVLRMTQELENLFAERRYRNIDEVINKEKIVKRSRGRKND